MGVRLKRGLLHLELDTIGEKREVSVGGKMKRLIIILVIIAAAAYFGYSYYENKVREAAEQKANGEKAAALREKTKAAVAKMVSDFTAVDDWEKKLPEGKTFTKDLQALWLGDKPILFEGYIKDISESKITNGNRPLKIGTSYVVLIHHTPFRKHNNVELSLHCSKKMLDSFLSENPKVTTHRQMVAVIARINNIESDYGKSAEGETVEMKVGRGACLDIRYAGSTMDSFVEAVNELARAKQKGTR